MPYSPTVSILIPTYYEDEELIRAINTATSQTYSPIEVIVVDDSGEEYAAELVSKYDEVVYISHKENLGANQARNTAYRNSSGEYIQLLDADDTLSSQKIEQQISVLKKQKNTGVVYCGVNVDDTRHLPKTDRRGDVLQFALELDLFPCYTVSMLIEREIYDRVTPLPESESGDDLKLMIELATETEFDFIPEVLVTKSEGQGRGSGFKNIHSRFNIIENYERYYNQYPSDIRQKALATTYKREGRYLLNNNFWSSRALYSYYQHFVHTPKKSLISLGLVISVIFGRPGFRLAKLLHSIIYKNIHKYYD